jgi:Type I restriction-modification system methyltransferase subunit
MGDHMDVKIKDTLSENFSIALEKLGFKYELNTNLYLVKDLNKYQSNPSLWFHLEKANHLGATAVYFRSTFEGRGELLPQVYIYDFSKHIYDNSYSNRLAEIQRKIWSSGEIPITCICFSTEIKILDCSKPINSQKVEPTYLVERILLAGEAQTLYNNQFANRIKSGVFWDDEDNINKFSFRNSAYDKLIINLRETVINNFSNSTKNRNKDLLHKLIIQSILIKYLEERKSIDNGKITKVFTDGFFTKFGGANSFCDVLRKGYFFALCDELNQKDKFNGKIFDWTDSEKSEIDKPDLCNLADALDGNSNAHGQLYFWRQYDFNYLPVELISRLYEEFIINYDDNRGKSGKVYTPAHLAKFLVDEAMPLDEYKEYSDYKILDPACGSGIFLVIAFKRLIQWWRLKNNFRKPSSKELKEILSNSIFGVDKDKKATQLTAFSLCLALCDELSPKEIWDDLHFNELIDCNLFPDDFFEWKNKKKGNYPKYNLIIGNPPFVRGGVSPKSGVLNINNETIQIPQNQIALSFLAESIDLLKDGGLSCLIIKSSGLLYNSSSEQLKKVLFSSFNIKQILDFTPLARNKCLWDNADVAAAAIFLKNEKPEHSTNILHAIFRRTKASKERIIFEIDDYDLHFVSRQEAIENPFIWKINLLGGGRIKNTIEKCCDFQKLKDFLAENRCFAGEGFNKGSNGKKQPAFMYEMRYLPTEDINEKYIDFSNLTTIKPDTTFTQVPDELFFSNPNIIIKENIGKLQIPVHFNCDKRFSFNHKVIGIYSNDKSIKTLQKIIDLFSNYNDLYRFFIFCTSGQILVNKNSAFSKEDVMRLPVITLKQKSKSLSDIDKKVIIDVNTYMQYFLRNGENSEAVKQIKLKDNSVIENFGEEYSNILNLIYEEGCKKIWLSDIIRFRDNKFIGAIFSYGNKGQQPEIHNIDYDTQNIEALLEFNLNEQINSKRIVKYYYKNKVIIIKPNQIRYWLSLIAYRDADKTFSDLSKMGN